MKWTPPWRRSKPVREKRPEEAKEEEPVPVEEEPEGEPVSEPEVPAEQAALAQAVPPEDDAELSETLLPTTRARLPKLPRPKSGTQIINEFEAKELRPDRPQLHPGDAIRVHATIREGDRERIQVFEGILIAMKHGGNRRTITVRKTSFGIAVERIFPLHSPLVAKIEVVRSHHVRRAKLYYLRKRKGKAARLREKRR